MKLSIRRSIRRFQRMIVNGTARHIHKDGKLRFNKPCPWDADEQGRNKAWERLIRIVTQIEQRYAKNRRLPFVRTADGVPWIGTQASMPPDLCRRRWYWLLHDRLAVMRKFCNRFWRCKYHYQSVCIFAKCLCSSGIRSIILLRSHVSDYDRRPTISRVPQSSHRSIG